MRDSEQRNNERGNRMAVIHDELGGNMDEGHDASIQVDASDDGVAPFDLNLSQPNVHSSSSSSSSSLAPLPLATIHDAEDLLSWDPFSAVSNGPTMLQRSVAIRDDDEEVDHVMSLLSQTQRLEAAHFPRADADRLGMSRAISEYMDNIETTDRDNGLGSNRLFSTSYHNADDFKPILESIYHICTLLHFLTIIGEKRADIDCAEEASANHAAASASTAAEDQKGGSLKRGCSMDEEDISDPNNHDHNDSHSSAQKRSRDEDHSEMQPQKSDKKKRKAGLNDDSKALEQRCIDELCRLVSFKNEKHYQSLKEELNQYISDNTHRNVAELKKIIDDKCAVETTSGSTNYPSILSCFFKENSKKKSPWLEIFLLQKHVFEADVKEGVHQLFSGLNLRKTKNIVEYHLNHFMNATRHDKDSTLQSIQTQDEVEARKGSFKIFCEAVGNEYQLTAMTQHVLLPLDWELNSNVQRVILEFSQPTPESKTVTMASTHGDVTISVQTKGVPLHGELTITPPSTFTKGSPKELHVNLDCSQSMGIHYKTKRKEGPEITSLKNSLSEQEGFTEKVRDRITGEAILGASHIKCKATLVNAIDTALKEAVISEPIAAIIIKRVEYIDQALDLPTVLSVLKYFINMTRTNDEANRFHMQSALSDQVGFTQAAKVAIIDILNQSSSATINRDTIRDAAFARQEITPDIAEIIRIRLSHSSFDNGPNFSAALSTLQSDVTACTLNDVVSRNKMKADLSEQEGFTAAAQTALTQLDADTLSSREALMSAINRMQDAKIITPAISQIIYTRLSHRSFESGPDFVSARSALVSDINEASLNNDVSRHKMKASLSEEIKFTRSVQTAIAKALKASHDNATSRHENESIFI